MVKFIQLDNTIYRAHYLDRISFLKDSIIFFISFGKNNDISISKQFKVNQESIGNVKKDIEKFLSNNDMFMNLDAVVKLYDIETLAI